MRFMITLSQWVDKNAPISTRAQPTNGVYAPAISSEVFKGTGPPGAMAMAMTFRLYIQR
jgi:hypothetical protein